MSRLRRRLVTVAVLGASVVPLARATAQTRTNQEQRENGADRVRRTQRTLLGMGYMLSWLPFDARDRARSLAEEIRERPADVRLARDVAAGEIPSTAPRAIFERSQGGNELRLEAPRRPVGERELRRERPYLERAALEDLWSAADSAERAQREAEAGGAGSGRVFVPDPPRNLPGQDGGTNVGGTPGPGGTGNVGGPVGATVNPEPGTIALVATGLAGLLFTGYRRPRAHGARRW